MWALGVVLYEVMALRRPFGGRNMDELISNICHARRNPLPSNFSQELRSICDSLLEVEPERRPSVRSLFHTQFIRKNLSTLEHSVERHGKIPADVRQQICACIRNALNTDTNDSETNTANKIVPKKGMVLRHTAHAGWQECELSLTPNEIVMTQRGSNNNAEVERIPVNTVTSVCSIDEHIAGEPFVFAMKDQTGKAFWFKERDAKAEEAWLTALQNAAP